jgi:probable rRNA maturation factor
MALSKISPVHFHFPRQFSLPGRSGLKHFIAGIFRSEKVRLGSVHYIFCTDEFLLEMNNLYLGHNYFTDIITFNLAEKGEPVTAEIYISIDRVVENARDLQLTFKEEILRVIFHGVLHLCGYGDKTKSQEKEMRAREDYYLKKYARGLNSRNSR